MICGWMSFYVFAVASVRPSMKILCTCVCLEFYKPRVTMLPPGALTPSIFCDQLNDILEGIDWSPQKQEF